MTATVPIERVELLARLYEGEEIQSRRIMPFPHRFFLGDVELPEFVIQALVDEKILTHLPNDAVWDSITYWVKDREPLRTELRKTYPKGWGRCEKCQQLLGLGAKGNAARHGADKEHDIPPCEGSGKPLAGKQYVAA